MALTPEQIAQIQSYLFPTGDLQDYYKDDHFRTGSTPEAIYQPQLWGSDWQNVIGDPATHSQWGPITTLPEGARVNVPWTEGMTYPEWLQQQQVATGEYLQNNLPENPQQWSTDPLRWLYDTSYLQGRGEEVNPLRTQYTSPSLQSSWEQNPSYSSFLSLYQNTPELQGVNLGEARYQTDPTTGAKTYVPWSERDLANWVYLNFNPGDLQANLGDNADRYQSALQTTYLNLLKEQGDLSSQYAATDPQSVLALGADPKYSTIQGYDPRSSKTFGDWYKTAWLAAVGSVLGAGLGGTTAVPVEAGAGTGAGTIAPPVMSAAELEALAASNTFISPTLGGTLAGTGAGAGAGLGAGVYPGVGGAIDQVVTVGAPAAGGAGAGTAGAVAGGVGGALAGSPPISQPPSDGIGTTQQPQPDPLPPNPTDLPPPATSALPDWLTDLWKIFLPKDDSPVSQPIPNPDPQVNPQPNPTDVPGPEGTEGPPETGDGGTDTAGPKKDWTDLVPYLLGAGNDPARQERVNQSLGSTLGQRDYGPKVFGINNPSLAAQIQLAIQANSQVRGK